MQKNKKVILHCITSLKVGGAEAVLVDLVRALGSTDYEHHVIYFYDGPNVSRLQSLGAHMHHITGFLFRYDPVAFVRFVLTVRAVKPVVIHSSLWAANLFARFAGLLLRVPTICAVHLGVETDGFVRNSIDRLTLRLADRVVAISDGVAQSLHERPAWVKPAQLCLVKNGIDRDHILSLRDADAQQRSVYGFTPQDCVIGTVGRFVPRKNFLLLITVFGKLYADNKNVRLLLVGQGPQEAELRALVHALQLDDVVTFVTGKMAYGYYGLMDMFVLPSSQEGLSIALLEAMSCGLPALVAHQGSAHDIIISGVNGLCVAPGDHDAFLFNLARLAEDKTLRSVLARAADEQVKNRFSVTRMAQEYLVLYNLQ